MYTYIYIFTPVYLKTFHCCKNIVVKILSRKYYMYTYLYIFTPVYLKTFYCCKNIVVKILSRKHCRENIAAKILPWYYASRDEWIQRLNLPWTLTPNNLNPYIPTLKPHTHKLCEDIHGEVNEASVHTYGHSQPPCFSWTKPTYPNQCTTCEFRVEGLGLKRHVIHLICQWRGSGEVGNRGERSWL